MKWSECEHSNLTFNMQLPRPHFTLSHFLLRNKYSGQILDKWATQIFSALYWFVPLSRINLSAALKCIFKKKTPRRLTCSVSVPVWGFESTTRLIVQFWKLVRLQNLSKVSSCLSRRRPCARAGVYLPCTEPGNLNLFYFFPPVFKNKKIKKWSPKKVERKFAHLLLIKVLNTYTVNTGTVLSGLVSLQSEAELQQLTG